MQRLAWLVFAHLLLLLAPARGGAGSLPLTLPAPQNFTGTAHSSVSIEWSWDAVLGSSTILGATRYELQAEGTNAVIASFAGPGTSPFTFEETGLTPGNTYCRHVVAFNGTEASSTADVCVTLVMPAVPCTVKGEGPDVIRMLATRPPKKGRGMARVTFHATPGDGEFDPNPANNSKDKISIRVVGQPDGQTMSVEVTGKKVSDKAGDANFTVKYTCANGEVHNVTWPMTILGDGDKHLDCHAVADPSGTGTVLVGITAGGEGRGIEFKAYSSEETTNFNWTSISDDGDASGAAKGDVSAMFENETTSTFIDYSVNGLKVSKAEGDVLVTAEVTCTSEEGAGKAIARRNWTVRSTPEPGHCNWTSEGGHGLSIPQNKKPVTVTVTFKAVVTENAQLKWVGPVVAGLPTGISIAQLNNAGGDTLVLNVTAGEGVVQSTAKNSFFIRALYTCTENGKTTNGSAIHEFTVYSLK